MKATLEFNLDNPDERMEHMRCVKSTDMAIVLFEIQYNLKKRIESHLERNAFNKYDAMEYIFDEINKELHEAGININEIII